MKRQFNFDTGVTLANNPRGPIGGTLSPNNVWVIPFEVTEDVPDTAELAYLCASPDADATHTLRVVPVVKPSAMASDFAYFKVR